MTSVVNFKVRTLLVLFEEVVNKNYRMNTSINLESLSEMPQQFGLAKFVHKKKKIDSLKTSSFSSIITKTIKMEDATIQKL